MADIDSDVMDECEYRDVCERICELFGVASREEIYYIDRMAAALECAKCEYGTDDD